jgi:hypothetical protein
MNLGRASMVCMDVEGRFYLCGGAENRFEMAPAAADTPASGSSVVRH